MRSDRSILPTWCVGVAAIALLGTLSGRTSEAGSDAIRLLAQRERTRAALCSYRYRLESSTELTARLSEQPYDRKVIEAQTSAFHFLRWLDADRGCRLVKAAMWDRQASTSNSLDHVVLRDHGGLWIPVEGVLMDFSQAVQDHRARRAPGGRCPQRRRETMGSSS